MWKTRGGISGWSRCLEESPVFGWDSSPVSVIKIRLGPPVPYPLLAAQAVRPDAVIDVYWRRDRQLYLAVERFAWSWCLVAPGERWQTGELRERVPSMEKFQRHPRRLVHGG